MAVSKITISLPSELVGELDRLAQAAGESRSLIVREAAAEYVAASLKRSAEERLSLQRAGAWASLAALRELPRVDTRSSAEIVAELRSAASDPVADDAS
jgi:predicted transcriptional regulator